MYGYTSGVCYYQKECQIVPNCCRATILQHHLVWEIWSFISIIKIVQSLHIIAYWKIVVLVLDLRLRFWLVWSLIYLLHSDLVEYWIYYDLCSSRYFIDFSYELYTLFQHSCLLGFYCDYIYRIKEAVTYIRKCSLNNDKPNYYIRSWRHHKFFDLFDYGGLFSFFLREMYMENVEACI